MSLSINDKKNNTKEGQGIADPCNFYVRYWRFLDEDDDNLCFIYETYHYNKILFGNELFFKKMYLLINNITKYYSVQSD